MTPTQIKADVMRILDDEIEACLKLNSKSEYADGLWMGIKLSKAMLIKYFETLEARDENNAD